MIKTPLIDDKILTVDDNETKFSESDPKIYAIFAKNYTTKTKLYFNDVSLIKSIYSDKIKAFEYAKNFALEDDSDTVVLTAVMEYEEGNLDGFEIPNNENYSLESKRLLKIFVQGSEVANKELYSEYLGPADEAKSGKYYIKNVSCVLM